jgi:hypothetical protein
VQEVSADGIRVNIDGDIIHVRPAAQDENADAPAASSDPTEKFNKAIGMDSEDTKSDSIDEAKKAAADVIKNAEDADSSKSEKTTTPAAGDVTADAEKSTDAAAGNASASGQTVAEPALGPSGLF